MSINLPNCLNAHFYAPKEQKKKKMGVKNKWRLLNFSTPYQFLGTRDTWDVHLFGTSGKLPNNGCGKCSNTLKSPQSQKLVKGKGGAYDLSMDVLEKRADFKKIHTVFKEYKKHHHKEREQGRNLKDNLVCEQVMLDKCGKYCARMRK